MDKLTTNNLTFLLRIGDAGQSRHKPLHGIDMNHANTHVLGKCLHHLQGLLPAQQTVINKHAGELITNRPMN